VTAPDRLLGRVKDLPTLPASVARLSQIVRDASSNAADFEKVIRPDPALTANLLKLANSAYFGLRSRAESARQAITFLGLKRVFEVAASAAFAPLIPSELAGYDLGAEGFWGHCVAVAVLSERLAAELRCGAPDLLFTAGLLHDMGKLAAGAFVAEGKARIVERMRTGLSFADAEREALGVCHDELGAAVAEAWSLPTAVRDAALWHHRPCEAPPDVDPTLVALVHVADALAHQLGFGSDMGELARHVEGGAERRLGVKVRQLEAVASASLEQIVEMSALFRSAAGGRA